jgi:hypothetical protein
MEIKMNNNLQHLRHYGKWLGAICSGLIISFPAISPVVAQQPQSQPLYKRNPCPRIFYEEPHNNRVLVPQGCPANEITRRYIAQGLSTASPVQNNVYNNSSSVSTNPTPEQIRLGVGGEAPYANNSEVQIPVRDITQPPFPAQQQPIAATITPNKSRVSIRLVNDSNAPISYQAIGDTALRTLPGRSFITLQGLKVPTTLTFFRQDRGLLMATPKLIPEGMLELRLRETTNFTMDNTALRIEANGNVFLN